MSADEQLTDEDWTGIADRAYDAASAEADRHGLSVFMEVFDEGVRRYESRGAPPPGDDESLRARIVELEAEAKTADELLSRWLADYVDDHGYQAETRAFLLRKGQPPP